MKSIYCLLLFALSLLTFPTLSSNCEDYLNDKTDNYFQIKANYEQFLNNSQTKKPANKWMNRWLWFNRNDFLPDGSLIKSPNFEQLKNHSSKIRNNHILKNNSWIPVGPIAMPPSYDPRSCYSMGRVNCIAFHPNNKNVFWIGTPGGGVWKTESNGKSWIPLTDFLPTLAISHIAVNPSNPDILYIATGDFDISGLTSANALGIYKSTDGGNTWELTPLISEPTFQNSILRKVVINPRNTNEIITAGRRGIWKSKDAGTTWEQVCDSMITDIEIHPQNPNILYAAMGELWGIGSAGILKSTNFGESWFPLETNIPPKGQISRMDVAISPAKPSYIYVINVKANTNGFHSLYLSTDSGISWELQSSIENSDNVLGAWGGDASDSRGQGSYDLVLIADQYDKEKVYAGGINIWASDNAGKEWDLTSFWIYVFGISTHADQHFAAFNPLDSNYYFCNDGGVYRTKQILLGSKDWVVNWIDKYEENIKPGAPDVQFPTVWENLSDGLAITEFYRMSLAGDITDLLAGGSQDNSCFIFNKGNWLNYIPNYDGMETMINYNNPDIFYGVWQFGGLCKTTDGGRTIRTRLNDTITALENGAWVTPTTIDPFNPDKIYMGFRNLWRSDNGGEDWTKVLDFDAINPERLNNNTLQIVKISPVDNNIIAVFKEAAWYRDTTNIWHRANGELWITQDGGNSWKNSTEGLPLDSMNIISIDFDSKDKQKIYVAVYTWYSNINTFVTTDGGDTWQDISKTLPQGVLARAIAHQPQSYENTIYLGTNRGVYYTNDSLNEWLPFSENLPNAIINDLKIHRITGEIYAATYGRGIWKTNLLPNQIEEANTQKPLISLYPNPSAGDFLLTVESDEVQTHNNVSLVILDLLGRVVLEKNLGPMAFPISKNVSIDVDNGMYFLQILINKHSYSTKLIINK